MIDDKIFTIRVRTTFVYILSHGVDWASSERRRDKTEIKSVVEKKKPDLTQISQILAEQAKHPKITCK